MSSSPGSALRGQECENRRLEYQYLSIFPLLGKAISLPFRNTPTDEVKIRRAGICRGEERARSTRVRIPPIEVSKDGRERLKFTGQARIRVDNEEYSKSRLPEMLTYVHDMRDFLPDLNPYRQ